MAEQSADKLRLDKWLWHARFFKTRTQAARLVSGGHVRVNGARVGKPAHAVTMGDVLTFAQARRIRVVQVQALGTRRGPASEAQALFTDLAPVADSGPAPERVGARPTKKDRRALESLRADGPSDPD
ncbi:RNA-binding S4 domain-containing protein [Sedimentitalea sp. JM2-8]|uniref:RNA-binding S4 domain-containing protein n=1 Tax=Sedimentitalea xiamensis TaxID=3050037 RepID=A0ABT7FFF3_9RHOB|nr:RNA-binding S4 domain-containing protein [Sedimentitalea xiamensis]MDK3073847.1 RNA-binding S4 domain-containing protein [Sedimentitalea xiamensis]